jgi:hypothetical protein
VPTSGSTLYLPPSPARRIDRMTPEQLSALRAWASALRDSRGHTGGVAARASALCDLLDLSEQAGGGGLRRWLT